MTTSVDVVVVGGGPAGLAAATEARRHGAGVLVLEREHEAGGIPRHSDHLGFGIRDLHRVMTGPAYARRLVDRAVRAGADVLTETMAIGWTGTRTIAVTGPAGLDEIEAGAVILATGCRERPRSARLVPGTRPPGVLTTGSLQRLVARGLAVGERAVVVGAEHVSFSAVLTLHRAGVRVAAVVTDLPRHQTYGWLRLATTTRLRVPVLTGARVVDIVGRDRVEGIRVAADAAVDTIACDTVVFTADWIPDMELTRLGGVDLDRGTRGPRIDGAQRTSRPGVFATGNLVHAAEAADTASRCGRLAARAVIAYLGSGAWPAVALPVEVERPLRWVSPNAIAGRAEAPPHGAFLARVDHFVRRSTLQVIQGERELWSGRYPRLVPGRPVRIPPAWIGRVEPDGPPVHLRVATGLNERAITRRPAEARPGSGRNP